MSAVTEATTLLHGDALNNFQISTGSRRGSRNSRISRDETVPGYGAVSQNDGEEDSLAFDREELNKTTWKHEVAILFRYSAPLVITYLLQYSYNMVMIYVSGQLGTVELAASSIASMTANLTGIVLYEAMATCLDTLTSQAYGNGKKLLVGLHIQRAMAFILVLTFGVAVIWFCSPWILVKILPDADVAVLAGAFLRVYIIGAPGYGIFEALKRLTQAQGNFTAPLIVALICAPLNILWNWLFVFYLDLGFRGAALAVAVSYDLQPLVLILYINFFAPSLLECWPGFTFKAAFQNWGPMIRLAVPSILMVISEWLAFEVLTFSASYLSSEHLAAQSVLMGIGVFIYHIPFPISIAASTRFGNIIGSGALDAARVAFRVSYLVFIGIGLLDIALLTTLRHVIAEIFTDDEVVKGLISSVIPVMAVLQMADATTAVSNGLLRGLGRQWIGGWVNLCAYYVFAIPLSLLLTFGPSHLGLFGLWIGPILGLSIVTVILAIYMLTTSWEKAVEEAQDRE